MAKAKEFATVEVEGEAAPQPKSADRIARIAELRAEREGISDRIERDRRKVKALSDAIRDLEGPLAPNKPVKTSFKMKKAE